VDDELKQKGPTSDMIFKVPFLISYISSIMTLMEGDVILTGNVIFLHNCTSVLEDMRGLLMRDHLQVRLRV
jgi:hypothetical protein